MAHKSQDPNFLEAGKYFVSAAALKKKTNKSKTDLTGTSELSLLIVFKLRFCYG